MSEGTWLECSLSGEALGARYGCAQCRVDDKWYFYGGAQMDANGTNHYLDDMVELTLTGSAVSVKMLKTTGVDPGHRLGASMFNSEGFLYLMGGTCNEFTLEHCAGLYKFDPSSNTWYEVQLEGDPRIVSQSISFKDNCCYMFGGVQLDEPCNRLFSLSLKSTPLKWVALETQGIPPQPRVDHCSAIIGDKMFVFGGSGSHVLWFNDLHCLDLPTLTWSHIKVSSGVYPYACDFSTLNLYDNNFLVLYGGSNDTLHGSHFSQVWYYSVNSNSWYTCDVIGTLPTSRHVHMATLHQDLMYVCGGLDQETTLKDFWVLQLHSNSLKGRQLPKCGIEDKPPPRTQFEILAELPPIPPLTDFSIPDIEKHSGLDQLHESVIGQISRGFSVLEAEYRALYGAKERFEQEKCQLVKAREDQDAWVSEQRDDLLRQCNEHTELCQQWADLQTEQFSKERLILNEERKRMERAQKRLGADQDILNKRVKKLEELMNRTKIQ